MQNWVLYNLSPNSPAVLGVRDELTPEIEVIKNHLAKLTLENIPYTGYSKQQKKEQWEMQCTPWSGLAKTYGVQDGEKMMGDSGDNT